jgi:inorganic pyrophosphatase
MRRKNPWDRLPAMLPSGFINVVVETPRGSQNKYKYDQNLGLFRLIRVLFGGVTFPFDFGFVAQTRGGDGDPLDVILLVDAATFPGCVVRARAIGVLLASKNGDDNHRILAVPVAAKAYASYHDISDVPLGRLEEVDRFFRAVLKVDGQEHELHGFAGREEATRVLRASVRGAKAKKRVVASRRTLPPKPKRAR